MGEHSLVRARNEKSARSTTSQTDSPTFTGPARTTEFPDSGSDIELFLIEYPTSQIESPTVAGPMPEFPEFPDARCPNSHIESPDIHRPIHIAEIPDPGSNAGLFLGRCVPP